jgi:hypothetical protein
MFEPFLGHLMQPKQVTHINHFEALKAVCSIARYDFEEGVLRIDATDPPRHVTFAFGGDSVHGGSSQLRRVLN